MKIKYWIEVLEKSEPIYPIVDSFINSGYGQIGGYDKKSGNNEREHCIEYWKTKNPERNYVCTLLRCHEMLLHIAKSFNVPDEDIAGLKQRAIDYVIANGRELKSTSPIAEPVMELIEKTDIFKYYDSIE